MENKLIACCGLDCSECGAYKAHKTNDDEIRKQAAAEWSQAFNVNIPYQTINCSGCTQEGVKFSHCLKCEIRLCTTEKGLKTCAECDEYACGKLCQIHEMDPEAEDNLDSLRN